jgi:hypothetical protein
MEAERPEVFDRLPVEPVDLLVRRGELGRARLPLPLERECQAWPGASAISKVMRPLAWWAGESLWTSRKTKDLRKSRFA